MHVTKKAYVPHPNIIGAEQKYAMNRFLDDIPDFRSHALMPDERLALDRNERHLSALKTRLRCLDGFIEV